MNRYPLVMAALAFITGILIADYTGIPVIFLWMGSLLSLILSMTCLRYNMRFLVFSLLTITFLGGLVLKDSQDLAPGHISNFTPYKSAPVLIEGIIDSDPVARSIKNGIEATSFVLRAKSLIRDGKENKVCGKILVKAFGSRRFDYGDRLIIEGKIYRVPYFRISKTLNYRRFLERQGIYSVFSAGRGSDVRILKKGRGNPLKAFAFKIRHRVKSIVKEGMEPFSADILNAIILGERQDVSPDLRKVLVSSGTIHIVAISGLHVGLVAFIILLILKVSRVPKRISYFLAICALIVYCLLTGARAPVIRATIMAVILLFGYAIERRTNIYNSLSLAALMILVFNPQQVFSLSFQLSFMSIISIVWLSPKIKSLFESLWRNREVSKKWFIIYPITLFSASLAAWLGLLPLVAYYFNIISPIAILANIVVVPYMTLVIGSGFTFIISAFIAPPLTPIFQAANEGVITLLFKLISFAAHIPGAYFSIPEVPFRFVVAYYLLIIACARWLILYNEQGNSEK